jgi:hypothetical protein
MALCFGFSAVSAWAIWEGNAGIAAASEFPGKGLYARSDMFPKNTVVLIENLETGIKVRAVVTGPSGVSGLVALLSPETASALNVRSGSVSRVRISIPTVVSEKAATGVTEGEPSSTVADPDVNPAVAAGAGAIPLASIAGENENPLMPLDAEEGAANAAVETAETPASEAAPDAGPIGNEAVASESGVAAEPTESASSIVAGGDGDAAAGGEAEAAPAVVAAAVPVTASEEAEETTVAPEEASSDAIVAEGEYAAPEATGSDTYYDEPELASGETAVPFEDELPVEEESVALVPTEMNPPSSVNPSPEPAPAAVAPVTALAPTAGNVRAAEPAKAETAAAFAALPLVGTLAKGSYYVQVASYADPVNAKKLVDGYSGKYPMVVEKGNDAKLKVCIGPVKKDEYGAIIERFRSLGFRDAFVRKGQ